MQQLEVFQSQWSMTQRRPDGVEWSLEKQFEMIADAQFDGIDLVFGDVDAARCASLLARSGLACTITAFPDSINALSPAIEMATQLKARHLNVIGKTYPFTVSEGAELVRGWQRLCDQASLPLCIETHRDSITTDLHYTLGLMKAVPDMMLCADLSHFVVSREFSWPISELVDQQIHQVLDRSIAIQGRVASREQIQLQISFAHHQEWFEVFQQWWAYAFESWCSRSEDDATLNFLCELGPPEYAMTGADGYELSDRWEEAQTIKQRVTDLWRARTVV